MERNYQGKLPSSRGPSVMSRRILLTGGGALIVALGLKYGKNLDTDLLSSEEKVNFLKTKAAYLQRQGAPLKFKVPKTFVEFRGNVFELYPSKANYEDGPLALIHGVNRQYNQDLPIKGDLANRALDLFNMISQNRDKLGELVENEIKSFRFKHAPTPKIKAGATYETPVYTAYGSLNEIIVNS